MSSWNGIDLDELVLTGHGLTLRPWQSTDADAVHRIMADPGMHGFLPLPDPYTEVDAAEFVTGLGRAGRLAGRALPCAVLAGGELVGAAELRLPPAREVAGEIGYWVAVSARGHRYAASATRVLAEWAFAHGVHRIDIRCAVGNLASARTALAAGFGFEGVLRGRTPTPAGPVDEAIFGRLAGDDGAPVRPRLPALPDGGLSDGVVGLRCATAADADVLYAEQADPDALGWSFTGVAPSRAAITAVAARAELDWLVSPVARLVIVDAASGLPAGTVTLRMIGPPGVGGIGYGVLPAFRGRGFTARALRLLASWAFDSAGFARLELGAKEANVASQRAAASGGFTPDGVRARRLRNPDGTFGDEVRFALVNAVHR